MIADRLAELGLVLPAPTPPRFAYVPVVVHDGLAWVAGQLPWVNGQLPCTGLVGRHVSIEQAAEAARLCTLQALAQLHQALGNLDRIERFVKLTGFVASAPGFGDQPRVMDAASQLLQDVFGEAGRHARSAVGVAELPRGTPVEIEFVAAVR